VICHQSSQEGFLINFSNNLIEFYSLDFGAERKSPLKYEVLRSYERTGHRSSVRTVALNDTDTRLLSGSGEQIKIWDTETNSCLRTFDAAYCTCSIFLPKNRYCVVGTKNGLLYLIDIPAAEIIQTQQAHSLAIWSIHMHKSPDGQSSLTLITGSADKQLKFWGLQISDTTSKLTLECFKQLQMEEDVHCVKYTPSGKYYVVSLLDNTMRIFYSDSDKLFLSLYGHKLPVLSLDISSDNALLISGSADKNVRLWGMDFGNCQRYIFAHDASIMQVAFVPETHYFFSASRDKTIKYWDGDTYELVMVFEESIGEIWGIAVASLGQFFICASHDKSLKKWV
jgi:U3 small nucleolar RNA-associated protein 12